MTVMAVDTPLQFFQGDFSDLPQLTNTIIYEGALVGIDAAGFAKPLAITDVALAGVAYRKSDSTGIASGTKRVKTRRSVDGGSIYIEAAVAGAVQASVGDVVHAVDDNPEFLTLTVGSNKVVGKVSSFLANGTRCLVRLDLDI